MRNPRKPPIAERWQCALSDSARREHEHPRHLHREQVEHRIYYVSAKVICFAVDAFCRDRRDQCAQHSRCSEQHRNEYQSTAKKYGLEETIFKCSYAMPQYAYEPEKCDPGKRHWIQRQPYSLAAGGLIQPGVGSFTFAGIA
jgi:hypothetical protein